MRNGLITNEHGDKMWYQDDLLHRTNGPAVEYADGTKFWFRHNQRHRTDGPAVEFASGTKHWFIKDHILSFNEWLEQVNYTEVEKTLMRLQYA